MADSLQITQSEDGLYFEVKVLPRASREQLCGLLDGKLKIKLTAPPVSGKANSALIKFLAKSLNLKQNRIKIVKGETSTQKQIFITGADESIFEKLMNIGSDKDGI